MPYMDILLNDNIPSVATPFTDAKAKEEERELRRDIKANLIARSKI